MTAFAQITQAVIGALVASPALAGGHVSGPLRRPVPPEWTSHIEVRATSAAGDNAIMGPANITRWQTTVTCDIYVRAAAGGTPDAVLDDLIGAVHQRVQALDLSTLGVSGPAYSPQIDWDVSEGDTPQAMASLRLTLDHDTRNTDLAP